MNALLPPHRVLEKVVRTTSLALRFRDDATGTVVGEGLEVEAYPEGQPGWRVPAQANRRGVYGFPHLPGLREFEHSERDDPWQDAPSGRRFVVEVKDQQGRYLACRLLVEAPRHGVIGLGPIASPLAAGDDAVPLFAAPTCPVPPGFGVVRAQVRRRSPTGPAAWMLAEMRERERRRGRAVVARGVADPQGRLTVLVPYPGPGNFSLGSPPTGAPQRLSEQRWAFRVQAWGLVEAGADEFLDVERVLRLSEGTPDWLTDGEATTAPVESIEVVFGRETIVPERGSGDPRPRELYLTGAGSPP